MREECVNNSGVYEKVWVENLALCSENITDNKCLIPQCTFVAETQTSYCWYKEKECGNDCDPCQNNTCIASTGEFNKTFKCSDGKYCTEDICTINGECWYQDIRCSEYVAMEGYPCFEPRCLEGEGNFSCKRKLIPGAYIDVCGNCIKGDSDDSSSESSVDVLSCTNAPPKPVLTEGLAAATIALIVIAAILAGALLTMSGVFTTKALIDRSKAADNQSAHNNPLFEGNETEMTNPTYDGTTM